MTMIIRRSTTHLLTLKKIFLKTANLSSTILHLIIIKSLVTMTVATMMEMGTEVKKID